MHRIRMTICFFLFFQLVNIDLSVDAFSRQDPNNNKKTDLNLNPPELSRRQLILTGVGVVYGKFVFDTVQKIQLRNDLVYPEAHERRVKSTIARAIIESNNNKKWEIVHFVF